MLGPFQSLFVKPDAASSSDLHILGLTFCIDDQREKNGGTLPSIA
jgi:hypothetical protein